MEYCVIMRSVKRWEGKGVAVSCGVFTGLNRRVDGGRWEVPSDGCTRSVLNLTYSRPPARLNCGCLVANQVRVVWRGARDHVTLSSLHKQSFIYAPSFASTTQTRQYYTGADMLDHPQKCCFRKLSSLTLCKRNWKQP